MGILSLQPKDPLETVHAGGEDVPVGNGADLALRKEIEADVWWPLSLHPRIREDDVVDTDGRHHKIKTAELDSDRGHHDSRYAERLDTLRAWIRNPETRSIFLGLANEIFDKLALGVAVGPRPNMLPETDEAVAILAYVIIENASRAERGKATSYVVQRLSSPVLEERRDGIRYVAASIGLLDADEFLRIPVDRVHALLGGAADSIFKNTLFAEWSMAKQPMLGQAITLYYQDPSRGTDDPCCLHNIPEIIEYNGLATREDRLAAMRGFLDFVRPGCLEYGHEMEMWVADKIESLKPRELLTELEALYEQWSSAGRWGWIFAERIEEQIKALRN